MLGTEDVYAIKTYATPPQSLVKISQVVYSMLKNDIQKQEWETVKTMYFDFH